MQSTSNTSVSQLPTTHSLVKYVSAIVASLPDDRVARRGEHVQLGHLGEHLENVHHHHYQHLGEHLENVCHHHYQHLGEHLEDVRLLERVVGDVQHRERLAPLQLLDVLARLQLVPELVRSHDLCQLEVVPTLKH